MKKNRLAWIVGVALTFCGSTPSRADIVLNWWDDGGILNFAGSGTWSTWDSSGSGGGPNNRLYDTGLDSWQLDRYNYFGGPLRWANIGVLAVPGGTGSLNLGVSSVAPTTPVPGALANQSLFTAGSGFARIYAFDGLVGTMNFSDSFVLPDLGPGGFTLNAGTQSYKKGADTITIHYGSAPAIAAVPEPSSALAVLGVVTVSFLRRRRRAMV